MTGLLLAADVDYMLYKFAVAVGARGWCWSQLQGSVVEALYYEVVALEFNHVGVVARREGGQNCIVHGVECSGACSFRREYSQGLSGVAPACFLEWCTHRMRRWQACPCTSPQYEFRV